MSDSSESDGDGGTQQGTEEQGSGGGGGQTGGDGQRDGDGTDSQNEVSKAEMVVIVLSVGLTVLLFAYAGWQMVTPPQGDTPQVTVTDTTRLADGQVAVEVKLSNPKDVGLITATVESSCATPPPSVELSYVPASSTRTATLICPPGTTDPNVSLDSWVSR